MGSRSAMTIKNAKAKKCDGEYIRRRNQDEACAFNVIALPKSAMDSMKHIPYRSIIKATS